MIDEIRRQFDLAWALAEVHLDALVEQDYLWEPAPLCWTVWPDSVGTWRADFSDVEPTPIPVPTIAWLTWHIDFWWSAAIAALAGQQPRPATDVTWAGSGTAAASRLYALADEWRHVLTDRSSEDLSVPATFPWSAVDGRTVADTMLWVTVELTKNIAEIGQLRLLRAAMSAA